MFNVLALYDDVHVPVVAGAWRHFPREGLGTAGMRSSLGRGPSAPAPTAPIPW